MNLVIFPPSADNEMLCLPGKTCETRTMEARGTIIVAAGIMITVQVGLFDWLKADIAGLTERVDRVEREVAFVRGQLSLVLPVLGGHSTSSPDP